MSPVPSLIKLGAPDDNFEPDPLLLPPPLAMLLPDGGAGAGGGAGVLLDAICYRAKAKGLTGPRTS